MKKTAKATKPKRRGGWPQRERAAVICRVHPDVSVWLDNVAAETGRSKSWIVERWITSLCELAVHAESNLQGNSDPIGALRDVERGLVQALIDLGLPGGWMARILDRAVEESEKGTITESKGRLRYERKRQ